LDNHISDTAVTGTEAVCGGAEKMSANGLALSCSRSSEAFVDCRNNKYIKINTKKHLKF